MIKLGIPPNWLRQLVDERRKSLARKFLDLMAIKHADKCLEIGGPAVGLMELLKPHFQRYLEVNIDLSELTRLGARANVCPILGDGCHLPFVDKSIDFVVSHAVIEHVPRSFRQQFAKEVTRVSKKGFFVSTNNYWFPYEPHYCMPFFQYIPDTVKKWLVQRFAIGYINRNNWSRIDLLAARELRNLFPTATIGRLGPITLASIHIFAYRVYE